MIIRNKNYISDCCDLPTTQNHSPQTNLKTRWLSWHQRDIQDLESGHRWTSLPSYTPRYSNRHAGLWNNPQTSRILYEVRRRLALRDSRTSQFGQRHEKKHIRFLQYRSSSNRQIQCYASSWYSRTSLSPNRSDSLPPFPQFRFGKNECAQAEEESPKFLGHPRWDHSPIPHIQAELYELQSPNLCSILEMWEKEELKFRDD